MGTYCPFLYQFWLWFIDDISITFIYKEGLK